ncbi:MAG: zinc-dependent metalloprotease [Flavobacteriales bacterium]
MHVRKFHFWSLGTLFFGLFLMSPSAQAQFWKKKSKSAKQATESRTPKKDGLKSIDELTSASQMFSGLLNLHQDTTTGKLWVEIPDSILAQEFIYFSYIEDGVAASGATRGNYRGSKIITFNKHYNRIEVHEENTNYHFDPASPLAKAADANLNTPILASLNIEGISKDSSTYLVNGNDLFLTEQFQMIKPPSRPGRKGVLGKLSKDKTKIHSLKNYPENTEIQVDYVYDNSAPEAGGPDVVDGRFITVRYQHSLLAMPDDGFTPRADDPRLGYFTTELEDMTSSASTPWLDMIHRWRLEKKDPDSALSEPVKPITWWVENTTPLEFRDWIVSGVEKWNQAFELIGFKDAVVVRIQPDDADWDAGDIRYNVLRWTSSPSPRFSGYGPSFVNPRTGEILGADIMLEWGGMVGRLWKSDVFTQAGMEDWSAREELAWAMHRCDAGQLMARNTLFGMSGARVRNFTEAEFEQFTRETLHRLVLHEVGHTLGLSHNMHGSTLHSPDELKNLQIVSETGLCNSVMDYPAINFPLKAEDQTQFYDDKPGFYDKWVIAYGYMPEQASPEETADALENILRRSVEPELVFGNDADDMRRPGGGMNPDVNIYDLSNDPVAYASERCELVNQLLPELADEYGSGRAEDYHEVRRAYLTLTGEYRTQLGVMTRQIGGIRYNRAAPDQQTSAPLQPVDESDQQKAMLALAQYAFAPDAFSSHAEVAGYLQERRRGFGFFSEPEDPKLHARILSSQQNALSHLLHPRVLQRLVDGSMYGNTYTIDEFMPDLTNAIFEADLRISVNTVRQQLQLDYIKRLMAFSDEKSSQGEWAKTMAHAELKRIQQLMKTHGSRGDRLSRAHRARIQDMIDIYFKG